MLGQVKNHECVSSLFTLLPFFFFLDPLITRAISALIYNVLKAFMEMNSALFDELASTYKSERQR